MENIQQNMIQKRENISINKYNEKGNKHGYWETYYTNGNLWCRGNYVDGLLDRFWEVYLYSGVIGHKGCYVNSKRQFYWENFNEKVELTVKEFYL